MDLSNGHGRDEADRQEEPPRVSAEGVTVRKAASTFGDSAVAVDLTIRSDRENHCTIRVVDELPAELQQNEVEFHPHYDPDHWTNEGDRVIYEAPVGPGVVRRTVYGVTIDRPQQLDLFSSAPTIEITSRESTAEEPSGDHDAFTFGDAAPGGSGGGIGPTPDTEHRSGRSAAQTVSATERQSVIDALVEELQNRELSRRERTAFREAIDLEDNSDLEHELRQLREAVEQNYEARESLADGLEEVQRILEREVEWRKQLRAHLADEPDDG